MVGRGRELTLPAWMKKQQETAQAAPVPATSYPPTSGSSDQFADAQPERNGHRHGEPPRGERERERGRDRDRDRPRDRDRDRREPRESAHSHRRSRDRSDKDGDRHRSSRRRSRSRSRDRKRDRSERRSRRSRSRSSSSSRRERRRRRKSNFDVRPPGVTEENAAAYAAQAILQQNMAALSGAVGPASFGPHPGTFMGGGAQQTRHARRIYVGGIGEVSEMEITEFFNDVIDRALGEKQEGGAVVSVYINRERHFAFVELKSIELTTACMNLDGVTFRGQPLKIRRPNDYNPSLVPKDLGPIPTLNLAALGIVSTTVSDGPGKIFIGGLPYHLNEEQVKELLQAFGPLKSFHLVKELNSNLSKGYGFCEYLDPSVTDAACAGLNDMKLGDKTLTVRRAMSQESARAVAGAAGSVNSALSMGLDPSQAAMQAISMAGIGLGIPSVPLGNPSRVVVLLNMVTPEELEDDEEYSDIVDDIKGECERYGSVQSIVVPRPRDQTAKNSIGKVFVEFGDVSGAQAAANELHGRGFSNRTVAVEFMDESKFERREFA